MLLFQKWPKYTSLRFALPRSDLVSSQCRLCLSTSLVGSKTDLTTTTSKLIAAVVLEHNIDWKCPNKHFHLELCKLEIHWEHLLPMTHQQLCRKQKVPHGFLRHCHIFKGRIAQVWRQDWLSKIVQQDVSVKNTVSKVFISQNRPGLTLQKPAYKENYEE